MTIHKSMTAAFWLAVAVIAGVLAFGASPAQADDTETFVGSVTNAPDNHCPTWARDSFERTTTITQTGVAGVYDVRQEIDGTWVSTADAERKGTLTGFVEYTVSGTLRADAESVTDDVDLSTVACKSDNTAPNTTGTWALRYFEPGATAGGITDWEYVYDTACTDPFVEDAASAAVGWESFTVPCPEPTVPTPTVEPSPSTGSTTEPTPVAASGDDEALPVTGFSWRGLLPVGGAALVVLGALALLVRRRKPIRATAE
jgi:hypothetical protein